MEYPCGYCNKVFYKISDLSGHFSSCKFREAKKSKEIKKPKIKEDVEQKSRYSNNERFGEKAEETNNVKQKSTKENLKAYDVEQKPETETRRNFKSDDSHIERLKTAKKRSIEGNDVEQNEGNDVEQPTRLKVKISKKLRNYNLEFTTTKKQAKENIDKEQESNLEIRRNLSDDNSISNSEEFVKNAIKHIEDKTSNESEEMVILTSDEDSDSILEERKIIQDDPLGCSLCPKKFTYPKRALDHRKKHFVRVKIHFPEYNTLDEIIEAHLNNPGLFEEYLASLPKELIIPNPDFDSVFAILEKNSDILKKHGKFCPLCSKKFSDISPAFDHMIVHFGRILSDFPQFENYEKVLEANEKNPNQFPEYFEPLKTNELSKRETEVFNSESTKTNEMEEKPILEIESASNPEGNVEISTKEVEQIEEYDIDIKHEPLNQGAIASDLL